MHRHREEALVRREASGGHQAVAAAGIREFREPDLDPAVRVAQHHPGVTVGQSGPRVVAGDEDRTAGIEGVGPAHETEGAQLPLHRPIEALRPERTNPVRAQDPERRQRPAALAGAAQRPYLPHRRREPLVGEVRRELLEATGVGQRTELGRVVRGIPQRRDRGGGVASHHRGGEASDPPRFVEAPVVQELDDARREGRRPGAGPGPANVREHRTRLDRRELRCVAEHHEPGAVGKRREHLRHEGEVHHRTLVEDECVDRAPIPGAGEEPPVHGRRVRFISFEGRNPRHQVPVAPAHRLLQPGRRLAGGGGERNAARRREPELDEQGHDRGRDGGLAGAGSARDHAEAVANGGPGRRPGAIARCRAGKEAIERGLESGREPERPRRRSGRESFPVPLLICARAHARRGFRAGVRARRRLRIVRAGLRTRRRLRIVRAGLRTRRRLHAVRKTPEIRRDRPLRRPEPLEIEPAPVVEDERAALRVSGPGDDRARGERPDPRFEVREPRPPGSRPVPARDLGQRDAGVSVPGPRARKRRRKRQLRPAAAAVEARDQRREVPVDVGEMALLVQIVQHRRSNRGPRVHVPGAVPRRTSGR